jgi:hypothetical protein
VRADKRRFKRLAVTLKARDSGKQIVLDEMRDKARYRGGFGKLYRIALSKAFGWTG